MGGMGERDLFIDGREREKEREEWVDAIYRL
jgi:hypothetical protein